MKSKNIEIPNTFGETDDNTHRRCFLDIGDNLKMNGLSIIMKTHHYKCYVKLVILQEQEQKQNVKFNMI
jgi:hypothetical protein